jgi:hypothetical protein
MEEHTEDAKVEEEAARIPVSIVQISFVTFFILFNF